MENTIPAMSCIRIRRPGERIFLKVLVGKSSRICLGYRAAIVGVGDICIYGKLDNSPSAKQDYNSIAASVQNQPK